MEAVWGMVGAAAAVAACCGLPLLAALAMAALGRRREGTPQEGERGHACCPPAPGAAGKGRGGDKGERGS